LAKLRAGRAMHARVVEMYDEFIALRELEMGADT
jgi:hypothetical protein